MTSGDVPTALRALGFRASRDALDAVLTHATKNRLSPVELCEQLVALEQREREARNLAQRTRTSALRSVPPLDRFDWTHPRVLDRARYEQLLRLDFLAQGENVLFRGASGVGKTTLAQNLGLAALQAGKTVRFSTLAGAIADLLKQESLPALERRLKHYTRPALLILDEIGYLPCEGKAADLLYTIISRRHEHRSTVMSTNLSFKQWGALFPGAACVGALVDRFVQHCHILDIDADSWREKHALQRQNKRGPRELDLLRSS
jgi:DNA replication protein DnaC